MKDVIRRVAAAAVVLALGVLRCGMAKGKAWFGTWVLDRDRSHFTGSSVTIRRVATGYPFDFGAVSFDVGDDGRDYPTVPTRSTSLQQVGPLAWVRVHKVNGLPVDHSTLTVTADGRSMLIHTTARDADAATHTTDERMGRVGQESGLVGCGGARRRA